MYRWVIDTCKCENYVSAQTHNNLSTLIDHFVIVWLGVKNKFAHHFPKEFEDKLSEVAS